MAKMIPAILGNDAPYSEVNIFDRLKNDPDTKNWIVLHSLCLSKTAIRPFGEIDFVILIPKKGIICLEIKGGEVSCTDGIWTTKNSKTKKVYTLSKSPYLQAREGMFALKRKVAESSHEIEYSKCPFSYAVVFPMIDSPPSHIEAEKWETIDRNGLRLPISKLILNNIDNSKKKLKGALSPENITPSFINKIKHFLRPDFERVISKATTICHTEEQLVSLTAEQYRYIDSAEDNDRVVVTGPAGTGKTLLALEYIRRKKDKKILFLCYNKVLSNWLRNVMRQESLTNVDVYTLHSYIKKEVESSSYAEEFRNACSKESKKVKFKEVYPLFGEYSLSEKESQYDEIIIDEAQDLISENNLNVINLALKGGLAGGKWIIFGDFVRQAIYQSELNASMESILDDLNIFSPSYVRISLKYNCRNTKQIGEETALLSGFDALPYKLTNIEGLPVDLRYYKNDEEHFDKLTDVLNDLKNLDVNQEDVVILSTKILENSIVNNLNEKISDVRDIDGEAKDVWLFSTIYSFKGMESKVVILTDINEITSDLFKSLLYVGMSRARSHLILIVNNKIRKEIPKLMTLKLRGEWKSGI